MPKILLIEDDISFCQMLQKFLNKKGYEVQSSFTVSEAKTKLGESHFDVVLTDLRLPDYDGIQLLSEIKNKTPQTPVIVMTGYAEVGTAVKAMKKGAYDYISKPFTPEEIVMVIGNALKAKPNDFSLQPKAEQIGTAGRGRISRTKNVTGISDASKKLNEYIKLVAPTDISVLVTGDSGTGKEVAARAIHDNSKRSVYNFVAVDCGAIPKELAASEFFGHVKGSFTGAIEDKIGTFEAANNGTLFLDEVGNLSYDNQIQLLRALQERKIKRVGSNKEVNVDVRIITATNEDLMKAVEKGTFREDLYHRLNEFSIHIPSLKERFDDLLLFADFFLNKANESLEKKVYGFSNDVLNAFEQYHWPGNLRELQNVVKRAVLLTTDDKVTMDAMPKEVVHPLGKKMSKEKENFSKSEFEKERIISALKQTNFNKSKAAKLLQVTRKTLYNKIHSYNLDL